MKRIVATVFCVFTLAGTGQGAPVDECALVSESEVEVGNCLVQVGRNMEILIDESLARALKTATRLDEDSERPMAVEALKAAQAAWQAYRDAQCEYVGATYGGGSGTGNAILSCRVELDRARLAELERYGY